MRFPIALPAGLIAAMFLGGCESLIYKLPTRQGNVIEQKQLDQLKVGMTREQVRFLLGTPLATSPFTGDRWDYLGYYKSPRGKVASRTVTLHFQGDELARMEGVEMLAAEKALETPDVEAIIREEKKEKFEQGRAEDPKPGVVIDADGEKDQGQPK